MLGVFHAGCGAVQVCDGFYTPSSLRSDYRTDVNVSTLVSHLLNLEDSAAQV